MTTTENGQRDELAQIKARLGAATAGPWQVGGMDSGHSLYETDWWVTVGEYNDTVCDMGGLARAGNELLGKDDGGKDAIFIAHAPADMAKLIAALEAVLVLAEQWRYKGEFGGGAWQEGHGPDPEGAALDDASAALRGAILGAFE